MQPIFSENLWILVLLSSSQVASVEFSGESDILNGDVCGGEDGKANLPSQQKSDQFFVTAKLLSFCTEKYGSSPNGSKLMIHSCEPKLCQSCLAVCKFTSLSLATNCSSNCLSNNHTQPCDAGCNYFLGIIQNHTALQPNQYLNTVSVQSTGYKFIQLKWNAAEATLPVFYIVFGHAIGFSQPTKALQITKHTEFNFTIDLACSQFELLNHLEDLKFNFSIIAVSRDGVVSTNQSTAVIHAQGFEPIDAVTQLHTVGQPFYTTEEFNNYHLISYKLEWESFVGLSDVTYGVKHVPNDCSFLRETHSGSEPKVAGNSTTLKLHATLLKNISCMFAVEVTSTLQCILGKKALLNIQFQGCNNILNVPKCESESKKPVAPTIIARKLSETFICATRNGSNCVAGHYNMTFSWTAPSSFSVFTYECRIYTNVKYGDRSVPTIFERSFVNSTKHSTSNLAVKTQYVFRVYPKKASVSAGFPAWLSMQGFEFTTKDIPTNETPASKTTPPHHATRATKVNKPTKSIVPLTSSAPTLHEAVESNTVALAAGLGSSLFAVILLFVVFCLFERRRRTRKKRQNAFELTNVSANYHATPVDDWEIPIGNIVFGEAVGEGAFGKVYNATVKGVTLNYSKTDSRSELNEISLNSELPSGVTMKAAVKILQDGSGQLQRSEFLEEIKLMKKLGQHKNIVSMLACVTRGTPLCLVVEFMPCGDLLHYLRARRSKILTQSALYTNERLSAMKYIHDSDINTTSTEYLVPHYDSLKQPDEKTEDEDDGRENGIVNTQFVSENVKRDEEDISPEDLLRFSWQISSGMEFLASKGFVHRDLAARNVLIGANKSCKISDFGLTRLVYEEKVYMGKRSRRLPIKWMSIEAIIDQVFTTASDVWSFGVLLFEIVTLGGTPYPTLTSQAMLRMLKSGQRMEKPDTCSDELYRVMMACWLENPQSRPTFTDIKDRLEALISEGTPYLQFDFDDSKPYYNVPSFRSIEDSDEATDYDDDDDDEELSDMESRLPTLTRRMTSQKSEDNSQNEADCKEGDLKSKMVDDEVRNEERYACPSKIRNQSMEH